MNRIEEQLTRALKGLRDTDLPEEARARLRAELLAYAELHAPSSGSNPIRSPFTAVRFRLYAGIAAAVILMAGVGGTAYASGRALPGDTLYSVKVGLTEPVQTALIPSSRGKAAWHAILAERRLDEATRLAARGELSDAAQTELAQNFDTHVTASQKNAELLEQDGDAEGSLSIRSDLEARLAAHLQILAVMDAHYAKATSTEAQATHTALSRMLALVANQEQAVASSRVAIEDALAPGIAHGTTTAALALADAPSIHATAQARSKIRQTSSVQVESAAAARTMEVQDILERNSTLLAKFLEASTTATTTATSTATSTASTTQDLIPRVNLKVFKKK